MNFLTNINLNGNELQNVVIQNLATDPGSPAKGQIWYNTVDNQLKYAKSSSEIVVLATPADVTNAISGVNTAIENKVAKPESSTPDGIVLFGENGEIKDSGATIATSIEGAAEGTLPTASAVANYVTAQLSGVSGGIKFRGILTQASATIPEGYAAGDMYYIGEAGTYYGINCEAGDIFIAKQASDGFDQADWSVIESNKDVFSGATTTTAGSSGLVPAPTNGEVRYLDSTGNWSVPANGENNETGVSSGWSGANESILIDGDWTITHDLGRLDLAIFVYEKLSTSGYQLVMTDIELIDANSCKISTNKTNVPVGQYFVVIK